MHLLCKRAGQAGEGVGAAVAGTWSGSGSVRRGIREYVPVWLVRIPRHQAAPSRSASAASVTSRTGMVRVAPTLK